MLFGPISRTIATQTPQKVCVPIFGPGKNRPPPPKKARHTNFWQNRQSSDPGPGREPFFGKVCVCVLFGPLIFEDILDLLVMIMQLLVPIIRQMSANGDSGR